MKINYSLICSLMLGFTPFEANSYNELNWLQLMDSYFPQYNRIVGVDMVGLDLSGINLPDGYYKNFAHIKLRGADLSGSNMPGAIFSGAILGASYPEEINLYQEKQNFLYYQSQFMRLKNKISELEASLANYADREQELADGIGYLNSVLANRRELEIQIAELEQDVDGISGAIEELRGLLDIELSEDDILVKIGKKSVKISDLKRKGAEKRLQLDGLVAKLHEVEAVIGGSFLERVEVRDKHEKKLAELKLMANQVPEYHRNTVPFKFNDSVLNWAKFDGANLNGATLENSSLVGASFKRATLRNVNLQGAIFSMPFTEDSDSEVEPTTFYICTDFRGARGLSERQIAYIQENGGIVYDSDIGPDCRIYD